MNVRRWLGISILLFTTLCLIGTTQFSAFAKDADDKKVEVSVDPVKETVKAGETKTAKIKLKRAKLAEEKDVALTVEVDPKDKGVTAKADDKVPGGNNVAKLTVETKDTTPEGDYKITVKSKSEGSADGSATFVLTVKKGEAAKKPDETKKPDDTKKKPDDTKKPEPGKGDLVFKAFDSKAPKFYTEQYTDTNQEMTVMGQVVVQKQKQWFLIEWTPKEMKDKNYVVTQKIVGVKMEIDIGGNKIGYDSTTAGKQKNPMTDFFDQLMKEDLTYTVKGDLSKVESIENREKFIKGLQDINPQMQKLLQAILSDKSLQKMAEPTWIAFPKDGVIPTTKKWDRTSDLDLGPIGKYETKFEFNLEDAKGAKGEDKIGIKTTLTYTQPNDKAGLPFIIHSAKLTASNGTGTALFDRAKGRFDSTEITMKLTGDLDIEVGSMKTKVTLNQTQTAKSTTYDELPAAWKAK
jgi:hypothetical protein